MLQPDVGAAAAAPPSRLLGRLLSWMDKQPLPAPSSSRRGWENGGMSPPRQKRVYFNLKEAELRVHPC